MSSKEATPFTFGNGRYPTRTLHPQRKIFPFFDLPPELRDMIYDATLRERRYIPKPRCLVERACKIPKNHLFLVNHQFRQELLERVSKISYTMVEGRIKTPEPYRASIRLRKPQYASNVEMHYNLHCDYSVPYYKPRRIQVARALRIFKRSVLQKVLANPNVRSIVLNLYLISRDYASIEDLLLDPAQFSLLTDSGRLKSLRVYDCEASAQGDKRISKLLVSCPGGVLKMEYSHKAKKLQLVGSNTTDEIGKGRVSPAFI